MRKHSSLKPVAFWLLTCCGMVFIMALIGAVTRLTESGLSITVWEPLMGTLPPLDAAAWGRAFAAYKNIPQFRILHSDMDLAAFKHIYFWEWLHRLWGRLIGLVFALPFAWFLWQRQISGKLGLRLALILAIGALQGFIGWFMVESGLEIRTSVSPYRLALHLGFALLLYALLLWLALDLLSQRKVKATKSLRLQGWITLGFLAVTMVWGALTAGHHAGLVYNTWPLMDDQFLPSASFTLIPKWQNIFGNPALVQFTHRWLGPLTFLLIIAWTGRCLGRQHFEQPSAPELRERNWLLALGSMAFFQVILGVTTLLTHVSIMLATFHQAGAITLLTLMLVNLQRMTGRAKA